jgi:hypothetical protein
MDSKLGVAGDMGASKALKWEIILISGKRAFFQVRP